MTGRILGSLMRFQSREECLHHAQPCEHISSIPSILSLRRNGLLAMGQSRRHLKREPKKLPRCLAYGECICDREAASPPLAGRPGGGVGLLWERARCVPGPQWRSLHWWGLPSLPLPLNLADIFDFISPSPHTELKRPS